MEYLNLKQFANFRSFFIRFFTNYLTTIDLNINIGVLLRIDYSY